MKISMWKQPYDRRHNEFKIRDLESVRIFMEQCLCVNQSYSFADVNNPEMYYSLHKDGEGEVTYSHSEYGMFVLVLREYDKVPNKIYKARKSVNKYFFEED